MSTYDRVATTVGDLKHPLYDDEHARDVWNEAGAMAYQAMSWALLLSVAVLAWVGGPGASLSVLLIFLALGLPSLFAMVHAQRHGVNPWKLPGTGPLRATLIVGLSVVAIAGYYMNLAGGVPAPGLTVAALTGAVGGGTVAMLAMLTVTRLARRSAPRAEDDDAAR